MDVNRIISELDTEIARLQQIRSALGGIGTSAAVSAPVKGKRGRPKGSKNATSSKTAAVAAPKPAAAKKQRKLTPEGRKRIADAMKRRWAERRKASEK
jgi:hypothetical protein